MHARGRRFGLKFETAKQPPQIKEFSYWFSTNLNQPINKLVKSKQKAVSNGTSQKMKLHLYFQLSSKT